MLFDQPASSQLLPPTDPILIIHKRLLNLNNRVITAGKDLSQIGQSLGGRDPEQGVLSDLQVCRERTSAYLAHALDVLWLYENMSSRTDRTHVRASLGASLKSLIQLLELEVKATNGAIAGTNKPGIVSTATDLKNAIRESIEALNAVRLL